MISIIQKFQSYPGYLYGIDQPFTMGEILLGMNEEEQGNLIDFLEKYIWPEKRENQNHKNKISFVNFFCEAFIALQQSSRIPLSSNFFTRQTKSAHKNNYIVALPTLSALANKLTVEWLIYTINHRPDKNKDLNTVSQIKKAFSALKVKLNQIGSKGQNYYYLINSALEHKIPILSFESQFTKFGIGQNQFCMNSTISDKTPFIGVQIVQDKFKTSRILNGAGMPGTLCFRVKNNEEAITIANKINYPVVIKPADLDRGLGVFAQLTNDEMVKHSYKEASKLSKNIIVEKHYDGYGHRFTFFNGKIIKVTKKLPMGIFGDGQKTIEKLIEETNNKKNYTSMNLNPHFPNIILDKEAADLLDQFNLTEKSIPEFGKFIPLRRKNNSSAGGSTELIPLENIHPDNIALCIRAAEFFKLDIAGIDLIIQDVKISWLKQTCAICEINAMPQTDEISIKNMLCELMQGKDKIEFHLRISFENNLKLIDEKIKAISTELSCNGYNSSKGLVIDNEIVTRPFPSSFRAAKALAQQTKLKKGLAVVSLSEIKQMGLPLNHFSTIELIDNTNKEILQDEDLVYLFKLIKLHADKSNF